MVSTALWLGGIALEGTLIVRAARGRLLHRFPLFYSYVLSVLIRSVVLFVIFSRAPELYPRAYWYSQFLVVLIGCGLVWEVYQTALLQYPGAARMAQNVLIFLFVLLMSRLFVKASNSPKWLPGASSLETERDLRLVQCVVLAGLVALLAYYAVPMGRNLKGIAAGYSFFLATSLIQLSVRGYLGESFQHAWLYVQPAAYLATLLIWLYALWTYVPAHEPGWEPSLEVSYQSLLSSTRRHLNATRTRLARTIKP